MQSVVHNVVWWAMVIRIQPYKKGKQGKYLNFKRVTVSLVFGMSFPSLEFVTMRLMFHSHRAL